MTKRENLNIIIEEFFPDEEILFADGYDDAIIGLSNRFGRSPIVAYDYDKVIVILVERDGMSYEEAVEFYDFNIIGAWVGDGTPEFIEVLSED